jgi:glutamate-1-semialdehyde aminotransferase
MAKRRFRGIAKSRAMLERSDAVIVRGCQGHKRSHDMLARGYPVFTARASGCRFWDIDGNEYVDYLLGFGPILLGYDDPAVNAAIRRQMKRGTIYTTAHPKEVEVAEQLCALVPGAEMLAYFIGGSGATSGAVRLARAYTGRPMVIRCGYHGWHDWTQPGGSGVPPAVGRLTLNFPYGDLAALEALLKQNEALVACVIVETVQGDGPPPGFLQGCVDLAHQYGALGVFDEIKVGFRIAFGGAGEYYNVRADLSVFGKACANGYPGSFVVGKREVLSTDRCQAAWLAATFHADLLSLVALETVIGEMKRRDGIAHQWKLGARLIEGINRACEEGGVGYRLVGLAPMPRPIMPPDEKDRCLAMLRGCLARGFYLHPGHVMFLSLAHTMDDIEATIAAVRESIADLK